MAHYKIYTASRNADGTWAVAGAAYTSVPGGNNAVGIPWTTAVVGWVTFRNRRFGGNATQASSPVNAATQTALDNGTLFEWRWQFTIADGLTGVQARAALETQINAQEAAISTEMADSLRYWGFEGDS